MIALLKWALLTLVWLALLAGNVVGGFVVAALVAMALKPSPYSNLWFPAAVAVILNSAVTGYVGRDAFMRRLREKMFLGDEPKK